MARAPEVDAMVVGEPEDAVVALASAEAWTAELSATVPAVTWRRGSEIVPHTAKGTFAGFATLWGAIAADVGASLLVVANALRLLRPGRGQDAFAARLERAADAMVVGKPTQGH